MLPHFDERGEIKNDVLIKYSPSEKKYVLIAFNHDNLNAQALEIIAKLIELRVKFTVEYFIKSMYILIND